MSSQHKKGCDVARGPGCEIRHSRPPFPRVHRFEVSPESRRWTLHWSMSPAVAMATTNQALIVNALFAMYDSSSWPQLANLLAFIEAQADPATLGAALEALWKSEGYIAKRGSPRYPNFVE